MTKNTVIPTSKHNEGRKYYSMRYITRIFCIIRKLKAIFLIYHIFAIHNLLNYDRLSKKPLLFRSFTGLELSQFDSICQEVESKYPEYEIKRLSKRKKERMRTRINRCRKTFQTDSKR